MTRRFTTERAVRCVFTAVFEILTFNDELRSCITQDCDKQELRQIVAKTDFVSMVHNADRLVEKGVTTVEEVCRTVSLLD